MTLTASNRISASSPPVAARQVGECGPLRRAAVDVYRLKAAVDAQIGRHVREHEAVAVARNEPAAAQHPVAVDDVVPFACQEFLGKLRSELLKPLLVHAHDFHRFHRCLLRLGAIPSPPCGLCAAPHMEWRKLQLKTPGFPELPPISAKDPVS